jgi:hypothetical protein
MPHGLASDNRGVAIISELLVNPSGGCEAGSGEAEEHIRVGVVPNGSLNGMKRSEKAEVSEREWATRSGG